MANITKDKNIYTFTLNPTKSSTKDRIYALDINTGEFFNVNTGRTLAGNPAGIKPLLREKVNMSCVINYIHKQVDSYSNCSMGQLNAEILSACDKLDSINCSASKLYYISNEQILTLVNHLGELAKLINEEDEERRHSLEYYANKFILNDFIKKYNLEINDYFSEDNCKQLMNVHKALIDRGIDPAPYMNRIVYHYQRGLWAMKALNRDWLANEILCKMVEYAYGLGVEIPKGDTMKIFAELYKNYLMHKTEIDNKALAEWNGGIDLSFENEEYCVIVPTTVKEFEVEGNNQQNCVYTMYLNKVVRKETRVVFVRRKSDPTNSYITCEVTNNGVIWQYLCKYNNTPEEASAMQFKTEYQNYLNELWAKGV